jgi:mRNA interferase MazF
MTAGWRQDAKAQAGQVRSIAVERIGATIGRVPLLLMDRLDDALRLHLAL